LPHELPRSELQALLLRIRIEEIGYKILNNQLDTEIISGQPDRKEDDSMYKYDAQGKRINIVEQAAKQKLLDERHWLIQQTFQIQPNFKPPAEYRPFATKLTRKIYIPIKEYPDYNFIGLIIGPRGMTQKELEKETGAKISIRGKGSEKDGKKADAEDEELHVMIIADNIKQLRLAARKIRKLMTPVEEDDNEHKKVQLRKLAEINGTLKTQVFQPIQRTWNSADVYCKHCGEISHTTMDCPLKNKQVNQKEIDSEYMSFMAEIGLGDGAAAGGPAAPSEAEKDYDDFMKSVMSGPKQNAAAPAPTNAAPWAQQPAPPAAPWAQQQAPQGYGAPQNAPWANQQQYGNQNPWNY
jgi:splicing factor 1